MLSQQMRIFLRVAECGSFTRASLFERMTPVAVMKHMNAMEYRLELTLFERSSRGVRLTSAGQALYEDGVRMQEAEERALARAKAAQERDERTIRVGSSMLNPCTRIMDMVADNRELFSGFRFRVVPYDDNREKILSLISSLGSNIDILVGVFNSKRMQEQASYLVLGSYRLTVSLSKNHRLAGRERIELSDLGGERLMMVRLGDTEILDNFAASLKEEHPDIAIEETDYYYDVETFNMCEQRECVLLTLEAWKDVHPNLVTIPLVTDCVIPYGILYAKRPSPQVAGFMARLAPLSSLHN